MKETKTNIEAGEEVEVKQTPAFWNAQRFSQLMIAFVFGIMGISQMLYSDITEKANAFTLPELEVISKIIQELQISQSVVDITAPTLGSEFELGQTTNISWTVKDTYTIPSGQTMTLNLYERDREGAEPGRNLGTIATVPLTPTGDFPWKAGYSKDASGDWKAILGLTEFNRTQKEYRIFARLANPTNMGGIGKGFYLKDQATGTPVSMSYLEDLQGKTLITVPVYNVEWEMTGGTEWDADTNYGDYHVNLLMVKLEGGDFNYSVGTGIFPAASGIENGKHIGRGSFKLKNEDISLSSAPNPYDRQFLGILYKGPSPYSSINPSNYYRSGNFVLAPYKLTYPVNAESLTMGQDIKITWDTNLTSISGGGELGGGLNENKLSVRLMSFNKTAPIKKYTSIPITGLPADANPRTYTLSAPKTVKWQDKEFSWKVGYLANGTVIPNIDNPDYAHYIYLSDPDYTSISDLTSCMRVGQCFPEGWYIGLNTDDNTGKPSLYEPLNIASDTFRYSATYNTKKLDLLSTDPNKQLEEIINITGQVDNFTDNEVNDKRVELDLKLFAADGTQKMVYSAFWVPAYNDFRGIANPANSFGHQLNLEAEAAGVNLADITAISFSFRLKTKFNNDGPELVKIAMQYFVDDKPIEDPEIVTKVSLNLTVPLEEGATRNLSFPVRFVLYDAALQQVVFAKETVLGTDYAATVALPNNTLVAGKSYQPWAWSTRHLPKMAGEIQIANTNDPQVVDVTFEKLLAGDVQEDGKVNTVDVNKLADEFLKKVGLTTDFNNDTAINFADLNYIAKNFAQQMLFIFENPFNQ